MISTITFEHGETTCASQPGKFCRWFGVSGFGTKEVCMLFDNEPLHDKSGWLQRYKQCMAVYPTESKNELTN